MSYWEQKMIGEVMFSLPCCFLSQNYFFQAVPNVKKDTVLIYLYMYEEKQVNTIRLNY